MNRKGVVYLFASILLLAIFLTMMYTRTLPTEQERTQSVLTRIAALNDFIDDFHEDLGRATFISGFRAFIAVEEYISSTGTFLTNSTPIIIEAFMNGSINNASYEVLENSTFTDYLTRVNVEAGRIGIAVNVSIENITLAQSTPWSVDISFAATINITDTRGLASWNYKKNFTTAVSIIDLRDPLYTVETLGKVPNTIRISPYSLENFVVGNDTTTLNNETLESYYRRDPHAPSFLQRLEGDLSANSAYGISSLVNLDELDTQGIFVYTYKSVVDAVYFSNSSTTNYCPGAGSPLPSWFKIDSTHYNDPDHNYELDDLNASTC